MTLLQNPRQLPYSRAVIADYAEGTRFELVVGLLLRQFSKLVVSATHPPFLIYNSNSTNLATCSGKITNFFYSVQIFLFLFSHFYQTFSFHPCYLSHFHPCPTSFFLSRDKVDCVIFRYCAIYFKGTILEIYFTEVRLNDTLWILMKLRNLSSAVLLLKKR